jgi:cytochrome c oxidase subunit 2
MPIAVEAVDMATFNQWVLSKGGTVAGAKPAETKPVGMTTIPVSPEAMAPAANAAATANTTATAVTAPTNRATDANATK